MRNAQGFVEPATEVRRYTITVHTNVAPHPTEGVSISGCGDALEEIDMTDRLADFAAELMDEHHELRNTCEIDIEET